MGAGGEAEGAGGQDALGVGQGWLVRLLTPKPQPVTAPPLLQGRGRGRAPRTVELQTFILGVSRDQAHLLP